MEDTPLAYNDDCRDRCSNAFPCHIRRITDISFSYHVGYQMLKFCKKCQTETERNYRGDCKPCKNEWKKAWRKANTEKVKASLAAYRAANKEKMKASKAAWRARNPEYAKTWHARNPEYAKIKVAEWKAANPERHAANKRNYKRNRRAKKKSAGGIHTSNDIKQLLSSQKGKCICCKSSIANNYHVDHIIPLALGGRNDKLNLQILCPTCNIRKGAKHPIDFMQSIGMLL